MKLKSDMTDGKSCISNAVPTHWPLPVGTRLLAISRRRGDTRLEHVERWGPYTHIDYNTICISIYVTNSQLAIFNPSVELGCPDLVRVVSACCLFFLLLLLSRV